MQPRLFFLFYLVLFALAGCKKNVATQDATIAKQDPSQPNFDPCALITKEEVAAIQGGPITAAKRSEQIAGQFRMSQCFYEAPDFSKSVNIVVTQKIPGAAGNTRDFWKEKFGRYRGDGEAGEKKGGRDGDEEARAVPPTKIDGIGDEAFWTGHVSSTLYVLKNDAFLHISLGSADKLETRLEKAKTLAKKILERL